MTGGNKDAFIHGQVLRTMLLVVMFAELGLTNGRQKKFIDFLNTKFFEHYNSHALIKNQGGFSGPKYILHDRIISVYNKVMTNQVGQGAMTIGPETKIQAVQVNTVFQHPDTVVITDETGVKKKNKA